MPDVWTHLICGREVLKLVREDFREMARKEMKLFNFGCQGPDFLFYYNFLPWAGDKRAVALGNRIHHESCGLFFRECLKYARDNPGEKSLVYIMGLMCHWCLDRATHPYINYISGVCRGDRPGEEKLVNNHKRVEAVIDSVLAKRFLNIDVRKAPAHREINLGGNLPREVQALYSHVLPLVFGDDCVSLAGADVLNKSYSDMIAALKVLYDPRGIKRLVASLYDLVSPRVANMRYYFYGTPVSDPEEYLNEGNRPWCHPMDQGEVHHESFPDLFLRGVGETVELIDLSLRFVRGEAGEAEIADKITDISHSTGKINSDEREMVYFVPVLP